MNQSKKSIAGVDKPVKGNFAIFNSQFCNQVSISNVLNFENSFIKNSLKIENYKLKIAAVVLVVFALFPTAASASLTSGLVGYWTFDGKDTPWTSATAATTLDKSGSGNTGTLTSMSRTTSPVVGKIGQGLQFDGVDDYVTMGDAVTDSLTTMTVSAWVKHNAITVDGCIACKRMSVSDSGGFVLWRDDVGVGGNDLYSFYVQETTAAGGSNTRVESAPNTTPQNQWVHVVATMTLGSSTGLKMYINGASAATAVSTVGIDNINADVRSLTFGEDLGVTRLFNGTIDDVRIYNRALSAGEVAQLYKQGAAKFAVSPVNSIKSGLVGYWTFDGKDTPWTSATAATTLDKSGSGNTGTLTSMSRTTSPAIGKIGQGLKFVPTQYVTINNGYVGNGTAFTISAWFRTTYTGAAQSIYYESNSTTDTPLAGIFINATTGTIVGSTRDDATVAGNTSTSASSYTDGKWHLATFVQISKSSRVMYVDGISVGTSAVSTGTITFNRSTIGYTNRLTPINPFNGTIDDVRIYSRALSAGEVTQLYKLGAAKFAVSPVNVLKTGLVGYWTFDGKDTPWTSATAATTLDKSGSGNTGTLTNMSRSTSPVAGKLGQGLKFDGSTQYTTTANVSTFSLFNSNWTTSVWIKTTQSSLGVVYTIRSLTGTADADVLMLLYVNNNKPVFITWDYSTITIIGNTTISDGKWHLLTGTYVYSTNTATLYVDGVQDATPSVQTNHVNNINKTVRFAQNISPPGGGPTAGQYYNGTADDYRIYNRALSAGEVTQLYKLGSSKSR